MHNITHLANSLTYCAHIKQKHSVYPSTTKYSLGVFVFYLLPFFCEETANKYVYWDNSIHFSTSNIFIFWSDQSKMKYNWPLKNHINVYLTYLQCDTISKVLNLDQSEQNIVELVIPYYFENVKIQKTLKFLTFNKIFPNPPKGWVWMSKQSNPN